MRPFKPCNLLSTLVPAALLYFGPSTPTSLAGEKNRGDLETTYLAVHSVSLKDDGEDDLSEFDELLHYFMTEDNPTGYGNPSGYVRFGLHFHFNPVSSRLFKLRDGAAPPYKLSDFQYKPGVVARTLDEAATLYPDAHITMSIMAGHCYESVFTEFLNQDPESNFMRNQYGEPIDFTAGEDCTSIYPFTPALMRGRKNYYLQALLTNARRIMQEVDDWTDRHPDTVVAGIGVGGPTIFPRGLSNKKADTRWADYRSDFIEGFRRYAREVYGDDFAAFLEDMGIPDGTFTGFSDIDPPRFDPNSVNHDCTDDMPGCASRGAWDLLGNLNNPYFAFWYEYRGFEISSLYRMFADMAADTGLDGFYLYSHQGVAWDQADSYLVKGSTLDTIDPTLTGLQPGLNMFNEKTNDVARLLQLRQLAIKAGSEAGTASFQYNPGGPCQVVRRKNGTKQRICSTEGYPIEEYLNRLHLAGGPGDGPRPADRFRLMMVMGDDKDNADAIRDNMRLALKEYLSSGAAR